METKNTQPKDILARLFADIDPDLDFEWVIKDKSREQIIEMIQQLKKEAANLCVLTGKKEGPLVSTLVESDFEWIYNFKTSAFYNPNLSISENLKTMSLITTYFSKHPSDFPMSQKTDFSCMGSKEILNRAYKINPNLERDSRKRRITGIGKLTGELGDETIRIVCKKSLSQLFGDTKSGFPLIYTGNFLSTFQRKCQKKKEKQMMQQQFLLLQQQRQNESSSTPTPSPYSSPTHSWSSSYSPPPSLYGETKKMKLEVEEEEEKQ